MTARHVLLACAVTVVAAIGVHAEDDDATATLRTSFKSSGLFARTPSDSASSPDRGSAEGLWRVRLDSALRFNDHVSVEGAVDQRARVSSSPTGLSSALPGEAGAPYRIRQLDWRLGAGGHGEWHLEIDRAALRIKTGPAGFTIGRQAIGWGRGAVFSAVDLFSPFTPLEADREWRRGVDAARAELKLSNRLSVDGVAALAADVDHSAFAARFRGYAGRADLELVAGRRARDTFAGATTSAAVANAEAHGEVAVFDTPDEGTVTKAVAGGSYLFALGSGVLCYVEYHFSGFGARTAADIVRRLADPGFQERFLRGDTQILGRHAVAVLASYEFSPEWSSTVEWLQSPGDGSGVIVPSTTLTFGDRASMFVSVYAPFGRAPHGTALASEYGASPLATFVQFRFYR